MYTDEKPKKVSFLFGLFAEYVHDILYPIFNDGNVEIEQFVLIFIPLFFYEKRNSKLLQPPLNS